MEGGLMEGGRNRKRRIEEIKEGKREGGIEGNSREKRGQMYGRRGKPL